MLLRPAVVLLIAITVTGTIWSPTSAGDDVANREPRPKRVLLLGQKPDSHPRMTHEYMAAARLIARLLPERRNLQVVVVQADSPWRDGPELLDGSDAVVVFLTEGAKWISDDPERLAAFQRLAKRGGGLSCIHWGMGSRELPPVHDFVELFGGCHGGPDRKYKVGDFQITLGLTPHPITSGISPFNIRDELYYDLKFPKAKDLHTTLLETRVADTTQTIAWAWERNDGGRSFGFTGMHFHENWNQIECRRLVTQGVLWTLKDPIPPEGLKVEIVESELALPDDPANKPVSRETLEPLRASGNLH